MLAETSGILQAPAFSFVRKYAARSVLEEDIRCTYRHVIKFFDRPDEELSVHERRTMMDWFSDRAIAEKLRAQGVTSQAYAQALVDHMHIIRAEQSLLQTDKTKVKNNDCNKYSDANDGMSDTGISDSKPAATVQTEVLQGCGRLAAAVDEVQRVMNETKALDSHELHYIIRALKQMTLQLEMSYAC